MQAEIQKHFQLVRSIRLWNNPWWEGVEATLLEPFELDWTKAELQNTARKRSCVGEGSAHHLWGIPPFLPLLSVGGTNTDNGWKLYRDF